MRINSILLWTLVIIVFIVETFPVPATSTLTTQGRFQRDATHAPLNKSVLFKGDINALLSPYLFSLYTPDDYHIMFRESPPETCLIYAEDFCRQNHTTNDGKYLTKNISSAQVLFNDTSRPITLCWCNLLPQDPTDNEAKEYERATTSYLLSNLSRLPASLRMHVDYVVSFPVHAHPPPMQPSQPPDQNVMQADFTRTSEAPHAFMSSRAVVLFGMPSFGTWVHEFAHALDVEEGPINGKHKVFTENEAWKKALSSDSCVADGYALTSASEVSQTHRLIQYKSY